MPPYLANFYIFSRDGFHHVGQAGLKFLSSRDLPTSASQSVGITGVSRCTWPNTLKFINVVQIQEKNPLISKDQKIQMFVIKILGN